MWLKSNTTNRFVYYWLLRDESLKAACFFWGVTQQCNKLIRVALSFFELLHTPETWKSSRVRIFRLDVVHERFVVPLICLWHVSVCRRVKYSPFCWTKQQCCLNGIHGLHTHILSVGRNLEGSWNSDQIIHVKVFPKSYFIPSHYNRLPTKARIHVCVPGFMGGIFAWCSVIRIYTMLFTPWNHCGRVTRVL